MKFLSKKLISVVTFATAGLLGMGQVCANPEVDALLKKADASFCDTKKAIILPTLEEVAAAKFSEGSLKKLFGARIYWDCLNKISEDRTDLSSDVKAASMMKVIDETVVEKLKGAFLSEKIELSEAIRTIILENGFYGNYITNTLVEKLAQGNAALTSTIHAWADAHGTYFARFFDPAKKAEVDAEIKAFKAKAAASMFNPLNWFKKAPKAAVKAEVPAPVEVVEPAVVLDTVWFDSAKALVSAATVIEETRKKELDKNLLVALNAWIANPANVASKMAELNAVAVKTSPAVVEYLKSLEILINSPVVDGITALAAYKAYAEAQWTAGNKMPALVLITKIELNAELAAK